MIEPQTDAHRLVYYERRCELFGSRHVDIPEFIYSNAYGIRMVSWVGVEASCEERKRCRMRIYFDRS